MKFSTTNPIYWGIGGMLVSYGLSKPTLERRVLAAAGLFVLAIKAAEGLSSLARTIPSK
ncbi:MAG TPA: hypothetical protein VLE22_19095 [Bryobacteraceae bacterium]|nr:hypothetical protein [Bryobacteraceae bacterium]